LAERESALAGHFRDLDQQREASTLGMWVFLVTEIMFFGGLFLVYTVNRAAHPAAFGEASRHLDVVLGGINTAVLICSSLTMALAVYAAQMGRRKLLAAFLVLTILLGGVFLVIKAVEYADKFKHHLIPGSSFVFAGADAGPAELFFSIYFAMTGLHALHMIVGVGLLSVLVVHAWRGRYSPQYHSPVELSGLYWHFVDIIWIFLFPLLYLIDRHHH